MKKIISLFVFLGLFVISADAQCAMCKKAAEDAGGINEGILYIMVFPYIILSVIGGVIYFRWKKIKKAAQP